LKSLEPDRAISIGSVIKQTLKNLGLGRGVERAKIFFLWEEIVGREIAQHARPEKLQGSELIIRVTSPSWASELSLLSEEILTKAARKMGGFYIKKLTFKTGLKSFYEGSETTGEVRYNIKPTASEIKKAQGLIKFDKEPTLREKMIGCAAKSLALARARKEESSKGKISEKKGAKNNSFRS
jgi:hypothetical protein